jgi:hypothetical protein
MESQLPGPCLTQVVTSKFYTLVVADDQQIYSCGLKSIRFRGQRGDALGAISRPLQNKRDAWHFGPIALQRASTASRGGWVPSCGESFTAFFDEAGNTLRVQGTILEAGGNQICFSSMEDGKRISFAPQEDDSALLRVSPEHRILSAVSSRRGLIVLVESFF